MIIGPKEIELLLFYLFFLFYFILLLLLLFMLHCVSKKEATWRLIITLANVDRFSKFFYQQIREKIVYV